jgi:DNA-binding GntR family transcriptional regulator
MDSVTGPGRSVQRALLSGQIADALRREILIGVLKPGTRMAQQQLCEEFGTSRMPVRDALKVLVNEGLLLTDVGHHLVVAPLSREGLSDAFTIEGMLAGFAAKRASMRASDADLDHLESLHADMLEAAKREDQNQMVELNWALHSSVNHLAASRKMLAALTAVSLYLPREYLGQLPTWNGTSNAEHGEILSAMRARHHELAGKLMNDHIIGFGKGIVVYLESQGLQLD